MFFDFLTSDEMIVLDAELVSDEVIEIRYEYGNKFVQPDPKTNVVIASFTTAYARLQLYEELDMLQERVLYYDTDSVIYLTQPGHHHHFYRKKVHLYVHSPTSSARQSLL